MIEESEIELKKNNLLNIVNQEIKAYSEAIFRNITDEPLIFY